MHPPPFHLGQRLSDWPRCALELHCACRGTVLLPIRMLLERGDRTFAVVLTALRCSKSDWSVELVPPPRQDLRRDD